MTGTGTKEQGPLPPLLLTLTVVTGVVDAVSILQLGRVFVGNMTGNVVFSAFAVVGAPGFSLSASLAALAGFLVGALIGGSLTTRLGHDRGLLLRAGVAAELVLVAAALALTAGLPAAAARDGIAALLALAMGVQNAMARRLAVPDLTTTVLTMTLTGIAADVRAADHGRGGLARRILSVVAMFGGGAVGALLVLHAGTAPGLGLATGLLAVVTAGAVLAAAGTVAGRVRLRVAGAGLRVPPGQEAAGGREARPFGTNLGDLREDCAAEEPDVVQVRDVVQGGVDGVGAGRAELGQPAEEVARGAGDAHGQHPGAGLAQGGGAPATRVARAPHRSRTSSA
jgi:uncharacterized membrane protein YoaK (UPF0700 family)